MQTLINSPGFQQWIKDSLENRENILATSNQGTLLKFTGDGAQVVVKCAMGNTISYRARLATLRREYEAYQRLDGLTGVPKCYGMINNEFMVLELIEGVPYRGAEFTDRPSWFEQLFGIIKGFHARGVSHGDLKSKSNLMVTADGQPMVIDFGTSFVHRAGFHPLNNAFYRYGQRLDINAWVKHKYHGRYEDASPEDQSLLNYSALEQVLRRFRPG